MSDVPFSVRLTSEQLDQIRILARALDIPYTVMIRNWILERLKLEIENIDTTVVNPFDLLKSKPIQYEYDCLIVKPGDVIDLNFGGQIGWKLVSTIWIDNKVMHYMKRQKL